MISRSDCRLALASLLCLAATVAGCKDKEEPPKAEPAPSASVANGPRPRGPMRPPMGPLARMDPAQMKEYRIDVCYFGSLTLKEARDAYLASMGKDEPSEKKIPSFGVPKDTALPTATTSPPTQTSASAKPAVPPTPPPKPQTSAAPGQSASAPTSAAPPPKLDFAIRAPHERNARACSAAATLKEPAFGDIDPALQAWAPFAVELAKDIATGYQYYGKEDYKKDNFAQGKALDKKLREEFDKLDDLSDKLGAAITAWRAQHKPDESKMDEGEKAARDSLENARAVILAVAPAKKDVEGFKANEAKLAASMVPLKAFAETHAADSWARMMPAPLDQFAKAAKDVEAKLTEKNIEGEPFLALIAGYISVIEGRQRAVSQALMRKAMPQPPTLTPSGTPAASTQIPLQPPQQ